MTPGFGTQQIPDRTLAQPIFQLRLFSPKISCADGCLYRPTSASRQLGILAFSSDSNFAVDVEFARAKSELPIGIRCPAHGVRCRVAPICAVGSSSRTGRRHSRSRFWIVHTIGRLKALARVGFPKYIDRASFSMSHVPDGVIATRLRHSFRRARPLIRSSREPRPSVGRRSEYASETVVQPRRS
jgi:hypothetical protein